MFLPKKSLAINGSLEGSFVTMAPPHRCQLYFIRRFDTVGLMLMRGQSKSVRKMKVEGKCQK